MRAFAVLAVILFHAEPSWAGGGFFGVDVFFVLSGYLITSLLVAEWQRSGSVSLRRFWSRRARRLLPALFLVLAVIGGVAAAAPGVLGSPHLPGDMVATVLYSANWHLMAEHADYFATVQNPSPLLHTWTLAIEEQFYVVWPLVVLAVLGGLGRRRRRAPAEGRPASDPGAARTRRLGTLAVAAALGALGSAALMAVLTPVGALDVDRAYYGSDTRAQSLLVGAALAAALARWGPVSSGRARRAIGAAGLLGAAGMVVICRAVTETSPLAFHGGFLLLAVSTAAVVACVAAVPRHPVARLFDLAPLRYVGRISYGMYLWYWPVLLVLTAARTGLHGTELLGARLGVIVALAAASFHVLEQPVRRGSLAGWRPWVAVPAAAWAVSLVAALAPVAPGVPASGSFTLASARAGVRAAGVPMPAAGARALEAGSTAEAARVRVLVVGDSMAGSLAVGLSAMAGRFGAEVVDESSPGCSLATDQLVHVLWYTDPPGRPCVAGDPGALLARMGGWVRRYDPDVVVYLARSDTLDIEHDGTWQHLGEPAFDRWVAGRYAAAAAVLGSEGARVVLLTTPYYDSGEQGDGAPWPENDPARVATENALLAEVADHSPGTSVFPLGRLLSPEGRYTASVAGVRVRCADGVHLTPAGGAWVGAHLLARLVALGRPHLTQAVASGRPPLRPQAGVPWWYAKLPCGT